MLHKTLIAFAAAAALGCLPMATTALAAHGHGGHAMAGHARGGHVARYGHGARYGARYGGGYGGGYVNGPIYDSCAGSMATVMVRAMDMAARATVLLPLSAALLTAS